MPETSIIDPRTPQPDVMATVGPLDAAAASPRRETLDVGHVTDVKEAYASSIARIITWTFAVCAGVLLIGMVLIALIRPAQAAELLTKDTGITLVSVGTFLSSVFGPLLAFVLGYYFGERKRV